MLNKIEREMLGEVLSSVASLKILNSGQGEKLKLKDENESLFNFIEYTLVCLEKTSMKIMKYLNDSYECTSKLPTSKWIS